MTNQSLDARLRESELKNEVKLVQTKADLIRGSIPIANSLERFDLALQSLSRYFL